MTGQDFLALSPYITITVGILLQMLVVSFRRGRTISMVSGVVVLVATLISLPVGLGAGDLVVTEFLRLDGYAAYFNGLFLVAAIVTAVLAHKYLENRSGDPEEFYILLGTATLGAMVLAASYHFAAFLLGLEILSISLYVLIAYSEEGHPPLEAALKYLVLSGVASTTMLFGMALIYNATGTLIFSELASVVVSQPRFELHVLVGQGLLFAGLAFKLSLVPFHMWTPDVYHGAPAPVSGYLATVSKGAVFAFVLRYVIDSEALSNQVVFTLVAVLAVLSMVFGNVLALLQTNVKRLLAYSSIGHVGYLLIALLAVAVLADHRVGAEAAMVYLAGYFAMTLAAFGVVTVLSSATADTDAESIDAYEGLFWRRPVAATILTLAMLSLAGIPLTIGFIAKFYLITAGIEGSLWVLVWALVLGSAVAIYYYLRVVLAMTRSGAAVQYPYATQTPEGVSILVMLGVMLIAFGIYPTPLIDMVRHVLGS
ncbi:MAG: NADH-quinone oxidoreductase subunit N [Gammaproteobacteria bacterium]|nr:NADH-quinone oxidoreductase subunit N [Gammaproteobacteria bacterium]